MNANQVLSRRTGRRACDTCGDDGTRGRRARCVGGGRSGVGCLPPAQGCDPASGRKLHRRERTCAPTNDRARRDDRIGARHTVEMGAHCRDGSWCSKIGGRTNRPAAGVGAGRTPRGDSRTRVPWRSHPYRRPRRSTDCRDGRCHHHVLAVPLTERQTVTVCALGFSGQRQFSGRCEGRQPCPDAWPRCRSRP